MIISLFYMEVGKIRFREGKQLAQVAKLRFKTRSVLTLKPEVCSRSLQRSPKGNTAGHSKRKQVRKWSSAVSLPLGTGAGATQQRPGELVTDS